MLRKILGIVLFFLILLFFIISIPSIKSASALNLIGEILDNNVKVYDKSFQITSIIYWNRLNKITKISKNFNLMDLSYENSYLYLGKDFIISKENNQFYIIDKNKEEKNYLTNGEIALVNKESNLFAIIQKNGLEVSFFQFVPIENKAVELKKEVFSCFYTGYQITRNSFYFSLMNGNCYIYNPFELISSENLVKNSPFIYNIAANSSSNNYIIISGYNPQKLSLLNKDGNILSEYQFEKSYTSIYSHLLDNQLLLLKNNDFLTIFRINFEKDIKIKELSSFYIKGNILDILEFYSYLVFICADNNNYYLVFYDYNKQKFYKKTWKDKIYQLDIIDSNGTFCVYNEEKIWILSLKQDL